MRFPTVSSAVLYTYYVVIRCRKTLVLCTGPPLGLSTPLGALIHCHGVKGHLHARDFQGGISNLELSPWNSRFLYPLGYLTLTFGCLIGVLWHWNTEILSSSSLPKMFFLLVVFPISVNGVTTILRIFLDFSPISFILSQQVPLEFSSKPLLHLCLLFLFTTIILSQFTLISSLDTGVACHMIICLP